MTQRALVVASIVGFAAALTGALLLNRAAFVQSVDLLVLGLNVVAAGIAGRGILGSRRVHRYFALGTVLFSAIAAAFLTSATTTYLISQSGVFKPASPAPNGSVVTVAVIGLVVYLVAATIYGFAGTRQGVGVGGRIGLLVLLVLSVIPVLNVVGLLGFTIIILVRRTPTTPAPPAASE